MKINQGDRVWRFIVVGFMVGISILIYVLHYNSVDSRMERSYGTADQMIASYYEKENAFGRISNELSSIDAGTYYSISGQQEVYAVTNSSTAAEIPFEDLPFSDEPLSFLSSFLYDTNYDIHASNHEFRVSSYDGEDHVSVDLCFDADGYEAAELEDQFFFYKAINDHWYVCIWVRTLRN